MVEGFCNQSKLKTYRTMLAELKSLVMTLDIQTPLSVLTHYGHACMALSQCASHIEHLTQLEWMQITSVCVMCVSHYVSSCADAALSLSKDSSKLPHITSVYMTSALSFVTLKTNSDPTSVLISLIPQLVFFLDNVRQETTAHQSVFQLSCLALRHVLDQNVSEAQRLAYSGMLAISKLDHMRHLKESVMLEFLALSCKSLSQPLSDALMANDEFDIPAFRSSLKHIFHLLTDHKPVHRGIAIDDIDFWSTQDTNHLVHLVLSDDAASMGAKPRIDALVGFTELLLSNHSNDKEPNPKRRRTGSPSAGTVAEKRHPSASTPSLGLFLGHLDAPLFHCLTKEVRTDLKELYIQSFAFWLYKNPDKLGGESSIGVLMYFLNDTTLSHKSKSWVMILGTCVLRRFDLDPGTLDSLWDFCVASLALVETQNAACFCLDVIMSIYPMTAKHLTMITTAMSAGSLRLSDASLKLTWSLAHVLEGEIMYNWLKNIFLQSLRSWHHANQVRYASLFRIVQTFLALCHFNSSTQLAAPKWLSSTVHQTEVSHSSRFIKCTYSPSDNLHAENEFRTADLLATFQELAMECSAADTRKIIGIQILLAASVLDYILRGSHNVASLSTQLHEMLDEVKNPKIVVDISAIENALIEYSALVYELFRPEHQLIETLDAVNNCMSQSLENLSGVGAIHRERLCCAHMALQITMGHGRQDAVCEALSDQSNAFDIVLDSMAVWGPQLNHKVQNLQVYGSLLRSLGQKIYQPYASQASKKALLTCTRLLSIHWGPTEQIQEWKDLAAWLMRLISADTVSSLRVLEEVLHLYKLSKSRLLEEIMSSRFFQSFKLISNSVPDLIDLYGSALGTNIVNAALAACSTQSSCKSLHVQLLVKLMEAGKRWFSSLMDLLSLSDASTWQKVAASCSSLTSRELFRHLQFPILWQWLILDRNNLHRFPYTTVGYSRKAEFLSDSIDTLATLTIASCSDDEQAISKIRDLTHELAHDANDVFTWILESAFPLACVLGSPGDRISRIFRHLLGKELTKDKFLEEILACSMTNVYPSSFSNVSFPHLTETELVEMKRNIFSNYSTDVAIDVEKRACAFIAFQIVSKFEPFGQSERIELSLYRLELLVRHFQGAETLQVSQIVLRYLCSCDDTRSWSLAQPILLRCREKFPELYERIAIDYLGCQSLDSSKYLWIHEHLPSDSPEFLTVSLRYLSAEPKNAQVFSSHDRHTRSHYWPQDIEEIVRDYGCHNNPCISLLMMQIENPNYSSWLLSQSFSLEVIESFCSLDKSQLTPTMASFIARLVSSSGHPFSLNHRPVQESTDQTKNLASCIVRYANTEKWIQVVDCAYTLPEKPTFVAIEGNTRKSTTLARNLLENCFITAAKQAKLRLRFSSFTYIKTFDANITTDDSLSILRDNLSRWLMGHPMMFAYYDWIMADDEFLCDFYSIVMSASWEQKTLKSPLWIDQLLIRKDVFHKITMPSFARLRAANVTETGIWLELASQASLFGENHASLMYCELAASQWTTENKNRVQSKFLLENQHASNLYSSICLALGEKDLIAGARQAPSLGSALYNNELVYESALFDNRKLEIQAMSSSLKRSGLYGMALEHASTTKLQAELAWKLGVWDIEIGSLNRDSQQELLFEFFSRCRLQPSTIQKAVSKYMSLSWISNAPRAEIDRTCAIISAVADILPKGESISLSTPINADVGGLEDICRGQEIISRILIGSPEPLASEDTDALKLEKHRRYNLGCLKLTSCLAKAVRVARTANDIQRAVVATTRLSDLNFPFANEKYTSIIKIISCVEQAQTAWHFGDKSIAIELLKTSQPLLRQYDAAVELYSTAEIYALLGTWCAIARHEDDIQIRRYFERAIQRKSISPAISQSRVSYLFASFCNRKYNSSDLIEAIEAARRLRDRKVEEIAALESLVKSRTSADSETRAAAAAQLKKTKRMHMSDCQDFERLSSSRDWYLSNALKYYLASICDGGKVSSSRDQINGTVNYGSVSVSCFCNLWLAHSSETELNLIVQESLSLIPTALLVPWINQLTSRLGPNPVSDRFQGNLWELLTRLCENHPFHSIYQILALTYIPNQQNSTSSNLPRKKSVYSPENTDRAEAGRALLAHLTARKKLPAQLLDHFKQFAEQIMQIVAVKADTKIIRMDSIPNRIWWQRTLPTLKMPVITEQITVRLDCNYDSLPYIVGVGRDVPIASGLSRPKIVSFRNSEGRTRRSIFKGNDDLRQDAIMQQVFSEVNHLFNRHQETRIRELRIRKYIVVPLGPKAGAIEFVKGAMALNDVLIDLHRRYRPQDWDVKKAREKMKAAEAGTAHEKVEVFNEICSKMQPVLRQFFFEKFGDPQIWYTNRSQYAKSTAAISLVGYILGLGDRHCNNILLDSRTGEPVHIDLGIAFDAGKTLRVPEQVPFRLTRDLVDGLGISGVNGIFRSCCEHTLRMLREESEHIAAILNVFKYDPLYSWTISPVKRTRMQHLATGIAADSRPIASNLVLGTKSMNGFNNEQDVITSEADRALTVVQQKLSATLSVEALVRELIQQAMDPKLLGAMFLGWNPFF